MLVFSTALKDLILADNDLRAEGALYLAEALEENRSLTSVNLNDTQLCDCDRFGHGAFTLRGVAALAEMLEANTRLIKLSLSMNSIAADGAKVIADALESNTTLENVSLGGNALGGYYTSTGFFVATPEGGAAVAEMLKINKTITNLNLTGNDLREEGAAHVAEALQMNTALRNMGLQCNDFKEEDKALLQAAAAPQDLALLF